VDTTVIAAFSALAGATISPFLSFLISYSKGRHQHVAAAHAQVSEQYRDLIDRLTKRTDELQAALAGIQLTHSAQTAALQKSITDLQFAHANCRVENENLRGEMRLLHLYVQQLRANGGFSPLPVYSNASIVVDASNRVIQWDSSAGITFHYTETEALGRHLGDILSAECLEWCRQQREQLFKVEHETRTVSRFFKLAARDGTTFGADVVLTVWQTGDDNYAGLAIHRTSSVAVEAA